MVRRREKRGPQFVEFFQPVLDALKKLGGSARPAEVRDEIAEKLEITEDELNELLDTGEPRFDNRVAWARFYLAKTGFIDSTKRGVWTLAESGRGAVKSYDEWLEIFKQTHAALSKAKPSPVGNDIEAPDLDTRDVGHRAAGGRDL